MKNGILAIVVFIVLCGGLCFMAYRLGDSNCREDIATETEKVQQMVQESDRIITEKVLGAGHRSNLQWLYDNWKRAD